MPHMIMLHVWQQGAAPHMGTPGGGAVSNRKLVIIPNRNLVKDLFSKAWLSLGFQGRPAWTCRTVVALLPVSKPGTTKGHPFC